MMMMMQTAEKSRIQKNNLSSAMNRFVGAVNDMDQTVMLPSMLRDLPMDEDCSDTTGHAPKSNVDVDGDMYSYYQLLKSMRRDMEWGVGGGWRTTTTTTTTAAAPGIITCERQRVRGITRKDSSGSLSSLSSLSSASSMEESEEDEEDEDLQKQFQYHLTGLQGVLSKLTRQAVCLTDRYKQELGIGEWGTTTPNCLWR